MFPLFTSFFRISVARCKKIAAYIAESERLWLQHLSLDGHLEGYHAIWYNHVVVSLPPRHILHLQLCLFISLVLVRSHSLSEEQWTLPQAAREQRKCCPLEFALPRDRGSKICCLLCSSSVDVTPKMIGFVGSARHSTNHEPEGAMVVYGIHAEYWGSGYASEALKLFLELY